MPGLFDYAGLTALLRQVDFQQTVLEGMLAFLLFAGALHVDVVSLRGRAVTIGLMATLPDLCITQYNCGNCQNILVDNNLIMITIANAPCGFFVLPSWDYAYLEVPTPADPSILMKHEAQAVALINRISQTLKIPIAGLSKSAMH